MADFECINNFKTETKANAEFLCGHHSIPYGLAITSELEDLLNSKYILAAKVKSHLYIICLYWIRSHIKLILELKNRLIMSEEDKEDFENAEKGWLSEEKFEKLEDPNCRFHKRKLLVQKIQ